MPQQDVAGFIDVARPVLGLTVDSHDAVVAANALVVLGGDTARVVEARLPVSTMAAFGVMIRMPRVCMSIVASAFQ